LDGLGSDNAVLDSSGNLKAAQLFAPYGAVRYATGSMPTDCGFQSSECICFTAQL
jgi:hypothetical protein